MAEMKKKRGGLLTAWLILMLIANAGIAVFYLLIFPLSSIAFKNPPPYWSFPALGIMGILNFVFTIFLFKWKKWAFFAFCVMTGITFVINNVVINMDLFSIFGLLGPVILYLLLRSKWNYLE